MEARYIDTHMHIESTMMIPENLARAILPWGTTTICTDPHEIGNVMGLDGVRFMLENAKKSKLRQYVLAPSCVPSLPGMENAGAEFFAREVGELLDMDDVIGIAEIMDYVGVIHDSERMHTIIDEGLRRGMFLQGHAPYCFGRELAAYRIGGPVSDHESVNADEVRAKLRAGMHINLRASSLIDNLSFLVDGCKDQPWRDFVSVCTDDVHAKDLLTVGHINNVVRKAVASGLDGREVVKMATFNAAREYGFDDLGAIAPGYIADIQLVDALDGSRPKAVFTEGVLVAEDGKYLGGDCKTADYDLPNTVDLPQITGPESFELRVPEGYTGDTIRVNVMVSDVFAKPPAAILDITGSAAVREVKLLAGKAVVKGEVRAQCAWRAEGESSLQSQAASLPFNQVVDLEGVAEDCRCMCVLEPVGFALAEGEQEASGQLTASVMMHLHAWRPCQLQYVADAFSTQFETAVTPQELAASRAGR